MILGLFQIFLINHPFILINHYGTKSFWASLYLCSDYWLDWSFRQLDGLEAGPTMNRVYSFILDRFRPPDQRFGPLGALNCHHFPHPQF